MKRLTDEERNLVERYLDNGLTGNELHSFLDRLETDPAFREEVSFQILLHEGINHSENSRLNELILKNINYKNGGVPLSLKLIFIFLLLTGSGLIVWNYIGPEETGHRSAYNIPDIFRFETPFGRTEDSASHIVKNRSKNLKPAAAKLEPDSIKVADKAGPKVEKQDTDVKVAAGNPEIFVKKDQLLISHVLKPILIAEPDAKEKKQEASIARNTADKLNPEGDLPENPESSFQNYQVEFWVSPVNYKGYRLIHNKLILFGIEEPDAVELYVKSDTLWMKYGSEFYMLHPSDEFEAFVSKTKIPSALR